VPSAMPTFFQTLGGGVKDTHKSDDLTKQLKEHLWLRRSKKINSKERL